MSGLRCGMRKARAMPDAACKRGFSLTELLVALAILALLAAAAAPLWQRQIERTRRLDAIDALLRIAVAQERFYLENGRYAGSSELQAAPPAGLGVAGTERGYYALELRALAGDADSGYEARAVARQPGAQAEDEQCRMLALDSTGRRSAETSGGANSSEACWP
ncbi:MAG: type IV pilin protein [Gammaproteobacteria bacterium]|nr:type IV pilin protein [Gammaproteobacteria bacterium]MCY4341236.1 type IV pilin protein [Gammaproteobacteria bacterium]